jgi:dCMP deaminase
VASPETVPSACEMNATAAEECISVPKHVDDWDEYFWWIAKATSIKSKDPRCPVGAVIVSADKVVLSTGFNGLPRGVDDDKEILEDIDEKLKAICHAEQNAIINAARMGIAVRAASIYVTKFPCLVCLNSIIQAGITRIYIRDPWYWNEDPFDGKDDTDHWRKRRAIRQTHITVDAPNHPEYSPVDVNGKKPPRRETGDGNGSAQKVTSR